VEANPALRAGSNGGMVRFDDTMDASRTLDRDIEASGVPARYRRLSRRAIFARPVLSRHRRGKAVIEPGDTRQSDNAPIAGSGDGMADLQFCDREVV
jgi:hypothetical protein